nr:T3SS regulon anti-activator ExsD domain-containing protein [Pseudomonas aeruginosa]
MEQEDDKQYSREAVFAGRRVSVVGSDARSRGRVPGYASSSLYRESGIISARQLALLQRMLPRLRLEQLFRCEWLQQRLARGLALGREEVRQILLCAAQDDDGWCAELGDRVNLAVPQSMIDWVLLPVYGWWESLLDQAIPGWRLSLVELETQSRQLRIKSEFWSRVAELEPEQRLKLFKLIWDATGSEFGARHAVYESHYSGNAEQIRLDSLAWASRRGHLAYCEAMVQRCMADYDIHGWLRGPWQHD